MKFTDFTNVWRGGCQEKEAKKKVQCQHCSEVINKKYITSHAEKCQLYVKFIRSGLECSICGKRFERRRDLNQHLGHNHREIVFLNQKSKFEIEKERKKKAQCQHCSNLFTPEYIKRHVQKCNKNFERRTDANQHIGHHKEVQFTLDISYFQVYSGCL